MPALLLAVLILIACGGESPEVYEGSGVVQSVDLGAGQAEIAHDEIQGFMPAMTMNFDVVPPRLLKTVGPGARVEFSLERTRESLRITRIEVVGAEVGFSASSGVRGITGDEVAPPFQLIDEQGREFALSDLRGKAVVLDFIFTRCAGPCPILTSSHVTLQRSLPREVATRTHFVSISVDPEHDTPSDLRRYAKERGADLGSWSFLTGDATTVHDVLKRYYVGTTPADGNLVHTVATYLITPNGHIANLYMGLEHDPAHLLQDLKQLLKD